MRKLIDIDKKVFKQLSKIAVDKDKKLKNYIEEIIQLHAGFYPSPQKDGIHTEYIDGTVLSGSWAGRIEQWEALVKSKGLNPDKL